MRLIHIAWIGNNSLSGPLPSFAAASALEKLDVSGNSMSGNLPASISNADSLVTLNLAQNNFLGLIPAEIGSIASLNFFFARDNQLTGKSSIEQLLKDIVIL